VIKIKKVNNRKNNNLLRRIIMKKQSLKMVVVSFIICCFVILVMGRTAKAYYGLNWNNLFNNNYNYYNSDDDDDDLDRGAHAYEVQENSGPGYNSYTYRQWTSPYDMISGNLVPEMTISYSSSNPLMAMMNPFQPYESKSEGNALGSLYPQSVMSFGSNPMMNYFANMYAPKYQGYSSQSMWGNTNYMMNYPGLGMSGFMWGPYSNTNAGYSGGGQYANIIY
jgi:hypothetical protein